MNVALVISILLHAGVLALAVFGLPQLAREEPIENRLVVVDVVTVAEVTNAPPPAETAEPDKTPPPPPDTAAKPDPTPPPPSPAATATAPAPPPPPSPEPAPPAEAPPAAEPAPPAEAEPVPVPVEKPVSQAPPEPAPVPVEKPEPPKPEPAPQVAEAPEPETAEPEMPAAAEVERVEDQAPVPVPVPVTRPTPPARSAQVARQETLEEKEPEPQDTFLNVLKTVQNLKKEAPAPQAETRPTPAPEADTTARRASFDPNQTLSVSEMDAIRQQISGCWLVPAGAKNAANLAVEIDVTMNPDRTVRSAQVVDRNRMQTDPFFRSAAESALRALKSPTCSPLQLPPEKYDTWKNFTITFDPRDMLS